MQIFQAVTVLACCEGQLKHLGVPVAPKKSTLAYANENRPWELYQTVFEQTLVKCQELVRSQGGRKKFRFKNKLVSLDGSIIDLSVSMFAGIWPSRTCSPTSR